MNNKPFSQSQFNLLHNSNFFFHNFSFYFCFIIVCFSFFFRLFPDALIQRFPVQRVLDVSSEWTEDIREAPHSSIQYDFRVTCDAHYYGKGCADLCRPRDDQFGHYTCSSSGSIVCLSGWQGDYCTKGKSPNFFSLLIFSSPSLV